MSALPDLTADFRALDEIVEAQPEGVIAEIAHGVYMMSPRPRLRHSRVQVRLSHILEAALGEPHGATPPDWLFAIEPELRSEKAFSRVVPDLAGWRRSTSGWPSLEENPVTLAPEWVAEILSPSTERFDRGPKRDAYGLMSIGSLWLVDAEARRVETYANVRGRMVAGPVLAEEDALASAPFAGARDLTELVASLFL